MSLGALRSNVSAEDKEKDADKKKKTKVHDMPGVSLTLQCALSLFTFTPTVHCCSQYGSDLDLTQVTKTAYSAGFSGRGICRCYAGFGSNLLARIYVYTEVETHAQKKRPRKMKNLDINRFLDTCKYHKLTSSRRSLNESAQLHVNGNFSGIFVFIKQCSTNIVIFGLRVKN